MNSSAGSDTNLNDAGNNDLQFQTSSASEQIIPSSSRLNSSQSSRRSSSRSIKRKKFDDEVVESSISYFKKSKNLNSSLLTGNTSGIGNSSNASISSPLSLSLPSQSGVSDTTVRKPKVASITSKRRLHRQAHINAIRDIGRWKPQDDLSLILAVQQTNDLEEVYRGVKFSCKFTLKEIENRWYALLYDPTIAKISVAAIRQLHSDVVAIINNKMIFSESEEDILKQITSNSSPSLMIFQELLNRHTDVFLPYRNAKCLHAHWTLMKHHQLLSDQQAASHLSRHSEAINFSDGEDLIEREMKTNSSFFKHDEAIHFEQILADKKNKREIRRLENEIPKWQVLVDSITGVAPSDFDYQTLAVLRGRLVRYLMRSREITLGRCTEDSVVDVNLALEGPAFKISRKQGLIRLQQSGEFVLANTGKRAIYVDSKPVLGDGNCAKLYNNSVVEIAGLRFVFLVNQELISALRTEAIKNKL